MGGEHLEAWADDLLLVFDGRVLEVFNFPGSGSSRFHAAVARVERGQPNRKGSVDVRLGHARRGGGGLMFDVPAADRPAVDALLDRFEQRIAELRPPGR